MTIYKSARRNIIENFILSFLSVHVIKTCTSKISLWANCVCVQQFRKTCSQFSASSAGYKLGGLYGIFLSYVVQPTSLFLEKSALAICTGISENFLKSPSFIIWIHFLGKLGCPQTKCQKLFCYWFVATVHNPNRAAPEWFSGHHMPKV
jgi:hypothetical protein